MSFNFGYHVRYITDCDPKTISFELFTAREEWVKQFLFDNQLCDSTWIEMVFDGTIEYIDIEPVNINDKDIEDETA